MTREKRLGQIVIKLLAWYNEEVRDLPWRRDGSPYHIWISEIMLQQTRVETVKAYYERFTKRLPDIDALASADDETVLKLWEGLGYYSRAVNLKKAAVICRETYGGCLPASYEALLRLPGIGRYTAGAVASIAFGIRAAAVDGNVMRILSRLLADERDIMKQSVRTQAEQLLLSVMPEHEPGRFNEALMELGETICVPNGMPRCEACPVAELCLAHETGREQDYPVRITKKDRRIEKLTVFLLEYGRLTAIRRRPAKGLLAGLYELPHAPGHLNSEEVSAWLAGQGLAGEIAEPLGAAKHVFSHVEWHMTGWRIRLERPSADYQWVEAEELGEAYPIPAAFRHYRKQWRL